MALSKQALGQCVTRRSVGARKNPITAIAKPTEREKRIDIEIVFCRLSLSFAPTCLAKIIFVPLEKPINELTSRSMIIVVAPTDATAVVSAIFPKMAISTALNSFCINVVKRRGNAYAKMDRTSDPCVASNLAFFMGWWLLLF